MARSTLFTPATGFTSRLPIAGTAISGSGVIDVNNAGSGVTGGWVIDERGSTMNFSGTDQHLFGRFRDRQRTAAVTGSATVNVFPGGVFTNHSVRSGVTIGGLNGGGDVTPAQRTNGTYNLTLGAGNANGTFCGHHPRQQQQDAT